MARKKPKVIPSTISKDNPQKQQEKPAQQEERSPTKELTKLKRTEPTHTEELPIKATPKSVSLSQVLAWKKAGKYELLEYHIRQGNIELLPAADALRLFNSSVEQKHLQQALQSLLRALQPLLEKEEALKKYIDPSSKWKLNVGRLMEEAMTALMPVGQGNVPLITLLKSCVDWEVLKSIPLTELAEILQKEELNWQPFLRLAENLELIPSTPKA